MWLTARNRVGIEARSSGITDMATDNANAAEAPTREAYITPTVDFVILLALACLVSVTGVAVMTL
ncbi:uncharacterized protein Nmlp_3379 [Natronomonas moolapensis 8.8.11]|uniref:Uncharacterized protein n=1 Tax=Natronomonas moolapensis (strain DSM 18674 / CECT 7526 / JCM 14361 / 8.8.11) TaxID=268739 RepID=M1Y4Q4_NATM8|nr:uncharacterized protein Nmlp_3379 [Natronomonas moolapensis 8.8.11]